MPPPPPYAKILLSVNGDAYAAGARASVPSSATIAMKGESTAGWNNGAAWEIFGFPPGWGGPAGDDWLFDSVENVWRSQQITPSNVVLPATSALWGKWLLRLIVNNGIDPTTRKGIQTDPAGNILPSQVVDISGGWQTLSPSLGLADLASNEGSQFSADRDWVGDHQSNLRAIEAALGAVVDTFVVHGDSSIAIGDVVIAVAGGVQLASVAALSLGLTFAGIAISNAGAGERVQVVTHGLISPAVIDMGAGTVCAIGATSAGAPARVVDVSCATKRKYVGVVDATGAIYVNPYNTPDLNALDYGADSSGTNLCDTSFQALVRVATSGDAITIPQGTYRYTQTIDLTNNPGVTVRGSGASHTATYAGTVLQYEGLGDAVRQGTFQNSNSPAFSTISDIIIRCNNENNQAPQRQSPSIAVGSVTGVASLGGLVEIHLPTHGLSTGQLIAIDSVTGTGGLPAAVNGGWQVTVVDADHFTLDGSTFVGAYTSGGNVRTRCGAGLAAIGSIQFTWRNVYCTGFGIGFLLDGCENCVLVDCQADGYAGNGGLGSNSKRFSAGIHFADGDSGCSGFTTPGSTNTITVDNFNGNGCRIVFQIDGTACTIIKRCMSTNIGAAGLLNTAITGAVDNGSGLIRIHAPGHGLLTNDFAGISNVGGTTEANGEWPVVKIDDDHIDLVGSSFVHAYTSGGVVAAYCPATFARINRAVALTFDTCYTEGAGDAHFMFQRQTGSSSAQTSSNVAIRTHFAQGNCPAILVAGIGYGSHAEVTTQNMTLLGNFWASKQCIGANGVTGMFTQIGDLFTNAYATVGQAFWDADTSSTAGVRSYTNQNTTPYVNGVGGQEPTAHWMIPVEDNATSILRVGDALPAFYLDFFVNNSHSSSWKRFVNSPSFGDKAGVEDDLRSASFAGGTTGNLLATSDALPPKSNSIVEITVVAHSDDDDNTLGSYWVYEVLVGQAAAGSLALIGSATLLRSHVGTGFPATLTIAASGSALTVTGDGHSANASTWQTRFEALNSQRAR